MERNVPFLMWERCRRMDCRKKSVQYFALFSASDFCPFLLVGRLETVLLKLLLNFLVAACLAFLSGSGVGGGSLLLLWLTAFCKFSPDTARTINLLFFLPTAAIATWIRIRKCVLNYHDVIPAAIAGCIAACIFTIISRSWNDRILQKLFGAFLLITGIQEARTAWKCRKKNA